MIRINLLPVEHRKVEHTPRPRLWSIFIGITINALLLVGFLYYTQRQIPMANEALEHIEAQLVITDIAVKKYDELKKEITSIGQHKSAVDELEKNRIAVVVKLDQIMSLLPENIWLEKLLFTGEKPPASKKKDVIPASIALDCFTSQEPYKEISKLRKRLLGQAGDRMSKDDRQKIVDFGSDVFRPLPAITGYRRSGSLSGGGAVYEWSQKVNFTIRKPKSEKKKPKKKKKTK